MTCKEGQFDVVELMDFSINLNAQHVNGMTQLLDSLSTHLWQKGD